ncbi:MAG: ABC transporter ATP-binding protein/permease [Cyclobacteriaceae bacterium]|nr:ABC transporter ATP-binding protein [Cyclobacteriaceae bacterium]MCB0498853.1 ABC transporter ATP-binding protein [Cyclobacteriaceae bacterium]MCB9237633.1 ABC transporter ATP-binding protein [Flammeovirgaceae bacterium]MCO5270265.1 ABC transporter ATP-binding protein/permease [Cyclobacteriaceae bacterium]MCW5902241.1 ABC transporter ATP-binding protein [Cyclobacteriaceae bacterium]
MKELRYLNKYLIKYKWHIAWGAVFVIISNIFQILPAQMVRHAIDLVTDNIRVYEAFDQLGAQKDFFEVFAFGILVYAALILVMALLRGIFLYFVRQTLIVMSRLIEYDLKNEIFEHYQTLPLSFYRRNNTGDLMNRISEDVGRVRMYLGPSIMYGLQLTTLFAMLIPVMFSISPMLTWYALIPLPILSFSIYYVNNIIERRSEEIQRSQSRLSTFVQEAFSGIRVLKSFTRENESIHNFSTESDEYKNQSLRLTRVQALFFPLITGLIGLSTILAVYAGGVQVISGSLTFGNIAEFIIYVNLLTWPVASLGWTSSLIQRAEASQKRINEFLKTKTDIISEENLEHEILGKIEFKNVWFEYPDTGIVALKDITFSIDPGESLAIIGTTGSGKSTIANLIGRLYDTTKGEIYIDGVPIKKFNLTSLRSQMGFVPQDVFLFSDTIYNNIGFGIAAPDEEKVKKAAIDADVYDNIMDFPQGFQTRVGERGITLSGGQKQRVSIARAVVRSPKVLVLDDALSAVDTKTENSILNSMKKIMVGRTSIIISHRVSSAKLANKIIVLHDGEIIEKGSHESLLAEGRTYRDLYEKQIQSNEVGA